MFDFISDIGSSEILRKTSKTVFNDFFFRFIKLGISLDESFFKSIRWERIKIFANNFLILFENVKDYYFSKSFSTLVTLESLADFLESTKIGGEILE